MSNAIDLRSDTVTQPDAGMWEAMQSAPLGDDVLGDDPTVDELEKLSAELCGKEAALFTPSGDESLVLTVLRSGKRKQLLLPLTWNSRITALRSP